MLLHGGSQYTRLYKSPKKVTQVLNSPARLGDMVDRGSFGTGKIH